jgi:hypothetical protein
MGEGPGQPDSLERRYAGRRLHGGDFFWPMPLKDNRVRSFPEHAHKVTRRAETTLVSTRYLHTVNRKSYIFETLLRRNMKRGIGLLSQSQRWAITLGTSTFERATLEENCVQILANSSKALHSPH